MKRTAKVDPGVKYAIGATVPRTVAASMVGRWDGSAEWAGGVRIKPGCWQPVIFAITRSAAGSCIGARGRVVAEQTYKTCYAAGAAAQALRGTHHEP